MQETEVRYAVRDGASLAFEVFGDGPSDVIIVKDNFPIDLMWELPQLAAFMDRLGSFARVIAFDDRGSGAFDPVPSDESAGLDMWCDDLIAVLDAADSTQATVFDIGGPTGIMAAATYPSRIRSLILFHYRATFPEFRSLPLDTRIHLGRARPSRTSLRSENPRLAHDRGLQQWWGRAMRLQSSPLATARLIELAGQMDVGPVLPDVRVPTLVFHRRENRLWDIEVSRAYAAKIPGARFVELPGSENTFFLGETTTMLDEIERFVGEERPVIDDDRALATVLFTDIVASTERLAAVGDRAWRQMLDAHDGIVDHEVVAHRGQVVKRLGDGVLATFDGPARAVRCAMAVRERVADRGIHVRGGLHTGEVEWRQGDVAGIAVHIASRVAALAQPDEILATRTLVDLTAGSGISYDARGNHELKGVPGVWGVFAASESRAAKQGTTREVRLSSWETIDFFNDASLVDDPYPYFEDLRAQCPVLALPHLGVVAVTGYDEANDVYRDPDTFSSCNSVVGPFVTFPVPLEGDDVTEVVARHRDQLPMYEHMVTMDPPQHTQERALLMRLITPKRLRDNEAFMWRLADRQLDDFLADGRCEFIRAYTQPFAMLVVADLLGVPEADHPRFREWFGLAGRPGEIGAGEHGAGGANALASLDEWFASYIEDRRGQPRRDVLTDLALATYPDGTTPPVSAVVRTATFLFAAGQETTARLLASALKQLAEHPELQDQLRAHKDRIPGFIEEVLRVESPVKADFRLARRTTTVGEVEVKAGTPVMLLNGAANRDPRRFECPNDFRADRPNGQAHLAFGRGIHSCPGGPLARAEGRVSLERILDRMRDIRLSDEHHGPPGARHFAYEPTWVLRGLSELHLEFEPVG